jgi:hypothetical protein
MDRALTYEQVVSRLAPCGIDCERGAMAAQGRVRKLATELGDALTGFDKMAARLADKDPALAGYEGFLDVLRFFTGRHVRVVAKADLRCPSAPPAPAPLGGAWTSVFSVWSFRASGTPIPEKPG